MCLSELKILFLIKYSYTLLRKPHVPKSKIIIIIIIKMLQINYSGHKNLLRLISLSGEILQIIKDTVIRKIPKQENIIVILLYT